MAGVRQIQIVGRGRRRLPAQLSRYTENLREERDAVNKKMIEYQIFIRAPSEKPATLPALRPLGISIHPEFLAASDGRHDQQRLRAGGDGLGQRFVRRH